MRTLLLVPALFSSEGGIERMMRVYAMALSELKEPAGELHIAAFNDDTLPMPKLAAYTNDSTGKIICGNRQRWSFALRVLWLARRLDRIICGHFHMLPLLDLAKRVNPRLSIFMVAHGTEIWRPWSLKEQNIACRSVHFLPVSRFTQNKILERCPSFPPERLTVIPNTFDPRLELKNPPHVERVEGRILTVARLSASDNYKGIDHLIEAMPLIKSNIPEAHLRIVGIGDDRTRLESLAARYAPDSIRFVGFVPDEDLAREYQQASLFALPSRNEGFGLVYLEAFKHGTPSLVAQAGAAPEIITASTGIAVPYGDIGLIANGCCKALATDWSETHIRAHLDQFSYSRFKMRLSTIIDGNPIPQKS